VIETYRMLGKLREDELLREARRLQASGAARGSGPRLPARELDALRSTCAAMVAMLRSVVRLSPT
jgi:hypothetical protein